MALWDWTHYYCPYNYFSKQCLCIFCYFYIDMSFLSIIREYFMVLYLAYNFCEQFFVPFVQKIVKASLKVEYYCDPKYKIVFQSNDHHLWFVGSVASHLAFVATVVPQCNILECSTALMSNGKTRVRLAPKQSYPGTCVCMYIILCSVEKCVGPTYISYNSIIVVCHLKDTSREVIELIRGNGSQKLLLGSIHF